LLLKQWYDNVGPISNTGNDMRGGVVTFWMPARGTNQASSPLEIWKNKNWRRENDQILILNI
jgi:hypothetical protein